MSFIVTLGSSNPDKLIELGFDPNYNYSVIETGSGTDSEGKNKQILKIRNPWVTEENQEVWEQ